MAIDTANDKVFAGVSGYGLYSTDILTGIEAPPVRLPKEYHLLQNYPNPFPEQEVREADHHTM